MRKHNNNGALVFGPELRANSEKTGYSFREFGWLSFAGVEQDKRERVIVNRTKYEGDNMTQEVVSKLVAIQKFETVMCGDNTTPPN